ncbi:hypothetical protein BAUCODRAFT_473359 [Baudoinia panamericana UAMH 10762]|uniref:Uncharacterized protein n=1 Tax=Baudoinia panamericana (strain UAMH 10762) TaxID=717646 RepID=M2NB72_BAUPA|nr:uncharacterized protein BAUCODRAFT_473359 [Baudoinia panamericana UAMH 10762]EMC96399.1 hypothetical protein BAUCODRAFT_473359 [Baudoinia panamericana UAMH 10762]
MLMYPGFHLTFASKHHLYSERGVLQLRGGHELRWYTCAASTCAALGRCICFIETAVHSRRFPDAGGSKTGNRTVNRVLLPE